MKRQNIRKAIIIISFLLLPITINYISPALTLSAAMQGVFNFGIIMLGVFFLSSLLFGRVWCGWICPIGGCQEIMMHVQAKKANNKYNWTKWLFWIPWLCAFIIGLFLVGGFKTLNFLYMTESGISVNNPVGFATYYGLVGALIIFSILAGKRSFCHYACPPSFFLIMGNKLRKFLKLDAIRLKTDNSKCVQCQSCSRACPMSHDVHKWIKDGKIVHDECIMCGACADACPKNVIKYGNVK